VITKLEPSEYGRPPCSAGYVAKVHDQMILGKQITWNLATLPASFVVPIAAAMHHVGIEVSNDPPGISEGGVKL